MHLIFCFRHAAQALTLREIPGSLESAPLLALALLSCLAGAGRGWGLMSSNEARAFFGDEVWMEWWEDWCEWCDWAGDAELA